MRSNNQKTLIFIFNYIISPITVLLMFGVFFFKGEEISIQKIVDHKHDPQLYIAIALAIIFLIFLRRGMKFPKDSNK